MKKHKYLFVACLSLFPVMAVAGNDTLHEIMEVPSATNINKNRLYKGKVVDDRTSEPLVGATVKVKGSTIGTITDIDGNFALDIPDNISPIVFEVSYMEVVSKRWHNLFYILQFCYIFFWLCCFFLMHLATSCYIPIISGYK